MSDREAFCSITEDPLMLQWKRKFAWAGVVVLGIAGGNAPAQSPVPQVQLLPPVTVSSLPEKTPAGMLTIDEVVRVVIERNPTIAQMAAERSDRYSTVESMRRDVELFLEGRSVTAKQDTLREQVWKLIKRNRGASIATAAAVVVLVAVLSVAFRINIAARTEAESNFVAFEKEQKEKEGTIKRSLPAFITVAQQQASEGKLADAHTNVELTLTYDPKHVGARLLKGQLHVAKQEWIQARGELETYLIQKPADAKTQQLLELCQKEIDPTVLHNMALLLQEQQLNGLAAPLIQQVQKTMQDRKPIYETLRKQVRHFYPGASFTLQPNGQLYLNLTNRREAADLTHLQGMPINELILSNTAVASLEPLKGMPLVKLNINGCKALQSLEPIRGAKLVELQIEKAILLSDFSPLAGMPLNTLHIAFSKINDLTAR